MKSKFVNGPVNCIRLEGHVNSIKKVLYLFMDFHAKIDDQTRCDDKHAQNIKTYFQESFYNIKDNNKIYDFFLDISPSELLNPTQNNHNKKTYIEKVTNFFKKEFNMHNKSNLPNLRLHYTNIIDYMMGEDGENFSFGILASFINFIKQNSNGLGSTDYDQIKKLLDETHEAIFNDIYDMIVKKKLLNFKKEKLIKNKDEYNATNFKNVSRYIINKILYKYKHDDIKIKFNEIIDGHLTNLIELSNDSYNNFDKAIKISKNATIDLENKMPNNKKSNSKIIEIYNDTYDNFYKYMTSIMDLLYCVVDIYFLRRFLDKDYVTNAIGYTDKLHFLNCIFYLVKYFDFKITHWSFLGGNINDITDKIKHNDKSDDFKKFFIPPVVYQCTDLSNFPENFE